MTTMSYDGIIYDPDCKDCYWTRRVEQLKRMDELDFKYLYPLLIFLFFIACLIWASILL